VSYWFEESLMAFLRESDLARVRREALLSEHSLRNPYGQEIIELIEDRRRRAWVGTGWRQYMYWFADFEARVAGGDAYPKSVLAAAEGTWAKLEDKGVLMEKPQNDGGWLRPWRRALLEAFREPWR
jgi:hypothetical protein